MVPKDCPHPFWWLRVRRMKVIVEWKGLRNTQ
jgi:hypothetical protein